jgi:hypothetical protein
MILFVTTAVKTSNPEKELTYSLFSSLVHLFGHISIDEGQHLRVTEGRSLRSEGTFLSCHLLKERFSGFVITRSPNIARKFTPPTMIGATDVIRIDAKSIQHNFLRVYRCLLAASTHFETTYIKL